MSDGRDPLEDGQRANARRLAWLLLAVVLLLGALPIVVTRLL